MHRTFLVEVGTRGDLSPGQVTEIQNHISDELRWLEYVSYTVVEDLGTVGVQDSIKDGNGVSDRNPLTGETDHARDDYWGV